MRKILKLISILLIASFALPLCAFPNVTHVISRAKTVNRKDIQDNEVNEIQQAIDLGIVPKGMSIQGNVTAKELLSLLTTCIKMRSGDVKLLTEYTMNTSAKTVWRQDAALALFYSAKAMKINQANSLIGLNPEDNPKGIKWQSKLFSNWQGNIVKAEGKNKIKYPKIMFAGVFVCQHQSVLSGAKLMEPDKNNLFNFTRSMTRKDAILAAYRLYTSFEEKPEYVSVTEVGQNTISADLLNKQSILPEISNQKIPGYKGFYNTNKTSSIWEGGIEGNRHYKESEIRFLSESGFNFLRVSLSFSALGYPDFQNGKVNMNELKELDQLISWGIKYNVHLCFAMCGMPGYTSRNTTGNPVLFNAANELDMNTSQMFDNPQMQKQVLEYWQMLAKRYKNVPSKFLSFLLIVEPHASSDKVYTDAFAPVVKAIRNENPDRVVFSYANAGEPCEGLAKMGCPLTWSFYVPNYMNYYGSSGDEMTKAYPYLEAPKWPMLYLPNSFNGSDDKKNRLVINGDFEKGTVGIYLYKKYMNFDTNLTILADDKVMYSKQIIKTEQDKNTDYPKEECIATIPDGTKKIELKVSDGGFLQYGRIQIKQQGKKPINIYPHDLWGGDLNDIMPTLIVNKDETVSTVEKELVVDFDYLYNWDIKPRIDLANKYNVGFLITEWGPFGSISDETRISYMNTILKGFKEYNIPWCYHVFVRSDSLLVPRYNLLIDNIKDKNYVPLEYDSMYYVNTKMLKLYKQY